MHAARARWVALELSQAALPPMLARTRMIRLF
jgi:hypothetical protein